MPQELVGKEDDVSSQLIPDFTQLETRILERTLEGMSVKTIAVSLKVPQVYIRGFLSKPKVKEYLKSIKESVANTTQLKLQGVLLAILEEQIDSVDNLADLTRKDPLEVMKLLSEISGQIIKQEAQEEETDKYASILEKVMK